MGLPPRHDAHITGFEGGQAAPGEEGGADRGLSPFPKQDHLTVTLVTRPNSVTRPGQAALRGDSGWVVPLGPLADRTNSYW
jgi:hypothetical protein